MADNNSALGLAILAMGAKGSGGGGSEPSEYLKSASVSGNELTLTKKDGTTVEYEPTVDLSAYRTSAAQDVIDAGKQDTLTAGSNISISNNVISATDTTYSAGTGISITDGVIANTQTPGTVVSGTNDGTNWSTITIDGTTKNIPAGGGSAEGAVKYNEDQSLTSEQKAQACKNIGMPYNSITDVNWFTNKSYGYAPQASDLYLSNPSNFNINDVKVGSEIYFYYKSSSDGEVLDSIVGIVTSANTSSFNVRYPNEPTTGVFFESTGQGVKSCSASYIIPRKKATESSGTAYIDTVFKKPTFNNKISESFIDTSVFNCFDLVSYWKGLSVATKGMSSMASPAYGSFFAGNFSNQVYQLPSQSFIFDTNNSLVNNSSKVIALGENLKSDQSRGCFIIGKDLEDFYKAGKTTLLGKYNSMVSLNKFLGVFYSGTTYNTDDVVCDTNGQFYKSLQDNNTGHYPSSGSTTEWWQYIGGYGESITDQYVPAIAVGNGVSSGSLSNSLTLDWSGNLVVSGTVTPSGADYAEYFEFKDGNPDNENRMGYLVTLVDGKYIKFADEGDEVLGICSGSKSVIGDSAEMNWDKKYITDDFDRIQYEDVIIHHEEERDPETGEIIKEAWDEYVHRPIINPEYDPTMPYVPRSKRKEWYPVGMLGKIKTRYSGELSEGDYVKASNGVAVRSEEKTNMRVLEIVNDHIARVLVK